MNYENLEIEIVDRLTPFTTAGITVEKLPELEADRSKPLPTKAKFTVIYAGSEYVNSLSTAQISQEEKIFIQILIESTFLRGSFGVYNLASILKTALTGFRPSGCRRMQVTKHHTIGGENAEKINNMWNYNVIFQTTSLHVEDFTEDLSLILQKITLIDQPDGEINTIEIIN
jgi:hypothetical protein